MNLAIHEFAHKLDMRNGAANGCPPLPPEMPPHVWKQTMLAAYEHFQMRVARGDRTAIDPYAAESPAEFFAVLSEVFFVEPRCCATSTSAVYQQFARFYRQEPAARTELLTGLKTTLLVGRTARRSSGGTPCTRRRASRCTARRSGRCNRARPGTRRRAFP